MTIVNRRNAFVGFLTLKVGKIVARIPVGRLGNAGEIARGVGAPEAEVAAPGGRAAVRHHSLVSKVCTTGRDDPSICCKRCECMRCVPTITSPSPSP